MSRPTSIRMRTSRPLSVNLVFFGSAKIRLHNSQFQIIIKKNETFYLLGQNLNKKGDQIGSLSERNGSGWYGLFGLDR